MKMRILVEPSDYILRNLGDTAMVEVTITRLGKLWPDALIQVFSDVPDLLPSYSPNAVPLDSEGRQIWFTQGFLLGRFFSYLPPQIKKWVVQFEFFLRHHYPSIVIFLLKARLKRAYRDPKPLNDFLDAVSKADLVIASGMGGVTDVFPKYATELLSVLKLAMHWGAATALVGQGIGPLQDQRLKSQASAVLPKIDFISLREELISRSLLQTLGVSADRLLTTGDDAIEIAYLLASQHLGNALGINVRAADYSGVDQCLVQQIRPILQNAAKTHNASIISVPISQVPGEADAETIQQIVEYNGVVDNSTGLDRKTVLEQIKQCRVVVAGSYHAAVFALSMGIPAIGLAKSAYYVNKFLGLADQFGDGCQVVSLNDADWAIKLASAIEHAWNSAEQVKPELLTKAAHQIELSYKAYQEVYKRVMFRCQQYETSANRDDLYHER